MQPDRAFAALFISIVLVLAGGALSARAEEAHRPFEVSIGFIHDDLAPYGKWVQTDEHGRIWVPRVERGWRPYTVGHWVWTDDHGWLWSSEEDFGWAVFHYGRWMMHRAHGWAWVPGYEWGPAWVAWRHGKGHVGWAPLPPRFAWSVDKGFGLAVNKLDALIEPRAFCFVPERAFLERGVHRSVLPPERNDDMIQATKNVTRYSVVKHRVVNNGVSVARVEKTVGKAVPRLKAVEVDTLRDAYRVNGKQIAVFRPVVRPEPSKQQAYGRVMTETEKKTAKRQEAERRETEQRLMREREQQRREGPVGMQREDGVTRTAQQMGDDSEERQRERQKLEQERGRKSLMKEPKRKGQIPRPH
jgi:hypothetical protein